MTTLLWDQHTCLPLHTATEVDPSTRYQYDGGTVLSVNAGYSPHGFSDAVALLHHYRAAIDAHPGLDLADILAEVDAATRAGRIAVVFDLEDSRPLDDDLENVRNLATLGVRTMLPTYNNANRAGSGCLDRTDGGLTAWGRAVVAEASTCARYPAAQSFTATRACVRSGSTPATSPMTRRGPARKPAVSSASPVSASSSDPTHPHSMR